MYNAFWVYGYMAYEIGKSVYDPDLKYSTFSWSNHTEIYMSPWLACNELGSRLYKAQSDFEPLHGRLFAKSMGGESFVGVKINADTDRLNSVPNDEVLGPIKKTMIDVLQKVGFSDLPEPKLYFMVSVKDRLVLDE